MAGTGPLRVIRLTPPGSGAIATLRVEGAGAVDAVARHCHQCRGKLLANCPVDRPILGLFGHSPGEPVVLHRCHDGAVELHCHGGTAAVERVEHLLADAGARTIDWQEWIRSHHSDPIAAEARLAMAHARTQRTASVLLDQYAGALGRAIAEVTRLLAAGEDAAARTQVHALLARAELGRHLTRPWRVVLAGHPNAGKSSLLNAMLGYERAIVHSTSGTTRDVLSAATAIDGWPVELIDTAGLSPPGHGPRNESVLNRGIALGKEQMDASDLLVLVFDRSVPFSDEHQSWLHDWPRALQVDNKSDLPRAPGARPPGLETSALQGWGVGELLLAIVRRLVPDSPPPGAAVPFTDDQCGLLQTLVAELPGS